MTGLVSGTPTAVGSYSFILAANQTGADPLRSPTITVSISPLPEIFYFSSNGAYGRTVSLSPITANTTGPGKYAVSAGTLPNGLSLNPDTGVISGSALASVSGLRMAFTDPDTSQGVSNSFDILADAVPLLAYPSNSYTGRVGAAFGPVTPTKSGLAASPNVRIGTGTLPPGIRVDPATGAISGTPSVSGAYPGVAFTANTMNGQVVNSNAMGFTIGQPSVSYADVSGQVGAPLSLTPQVSYFDGPQFFVNSGTLPAGVNLYSSNGTISGTPTAAGSFPLTVLAYDASLIQAISPTFTLSIAPALATASTSSVSVVEGSPVSFSATSSFTNPTWSAAGNPAWMRFTQSGGSYATTSVSADVTSTESYPVVLTAKDASGATISTDVAVQVSPATASVADVSARSGGTFSTPVTQSMAAAGSWTATSSPADVTGLSVSGGKLMGNAPANAGTPSAARTLTVTYTATAVPSAGTAAKASGSGTLTVYPGLAIGNLAAQTLPTNATASIAAPGVTGQVGTLTYTLMQGTTDVSSTLSSTCAGLSFSKSSGAITGTPTAVCTVSLTHRVSDNGGGVAGLAATATSSSPFTLSVVSATVTASTNALTVTEGDTVAFSATTGLPNPTWSASGNPAWMVFTATGGTYATSSVSADVTATETYTVTLKATGGGSSAQQAVTVTVNPSTVTLATPAPVRSGGAFSAAVAKDMKAAGAWTSSASPADVATLAVTGSNLTGIAPANPGPGVLSRTLSVAYSASSAPSAGSRATASASSSLSVYAGLTLAAPSNQGGTAGNTVAFAAPVVTGQVGTLAWTLLKGSTDISNSLAATCPGLSFSKSTGAVSGTATSACSATLAYRVADDGGASPSLAASATSSTFALTVVPAAATASTSSVSVVEGDPVAFSATTALANPTWTASGNPAWMTFTTSGGTYATNSVSPDVSASTSFTVVLTATNGSDASSTTSVPVTVTPAAVTLAAAATRSGGAFTAAVSETMNAAGTWSATASPADVTALAVSGSTLTGTSPTNAGTAAVTRALTATYAASAAPSTGATAAAAGGSTLTVYPLLIVGNQAGQSLYTGTTATIAAPSVTGRIGTLTWSLLSGTTDISASLSSTCAGLSFSTSTGAITGTPTAACSPSLTYAVADNGGGAVSLAATASSQPFTLTVTAATVTVSQSTVGVQEGQTVAFTATTNIANPTWSLAGTPPAWMTMTSSGNTATVSSVSGDVTAATNYFPILKAVSGAASAQQQVQVSVTPATATLSTPPKVHGGKPFTATVSTDMATAGSWSASASPADVTGLAVSGTTLSGTAPANAGSGNLTRTLTAAYVDSSVPSSGTAATATGTSTLTVIPPVSASVDKTISVATKANVSMVGPSALNLVGTAAWSTASALPAGLSVDAASGKLVGQATQAGTFPVTFVVTDADGTTASASSTLTVTSSDPVLVFTDTYNSVPWSNNVTWNMPGPVTTASYQNYGFTLKNTGPTGATGIHFSVNGDSVDPGAFVYGYYTDGTTLHEYSPTKAYSSSTFGTECFTNLPPGKTCYVIINFKPAFDDQKLGAIRVTASNVDQPTGFNINVTAAKILQPGRMIVNASTNFQAIQLPVYKTITARYMLLSGGVAGTKGSPPAGGNGAVVMTGWVTSTNTGGLVSYVAKGQQPGGDLSLSASSLKADYSTATSSTAYASFTGPYAGYGVSAGGGRTDSTAAGMAHGYDGGSGTIGGGAYLRGTVSGGPYYKDLTTNHPAAPVSFNQMTWSYGAGGRGGGNGVQCSGYNYISTGSGGGGGIVFDGNVVDAGARDGGATGYQGTAGAGYGAGGGGGTLASSPCPVTTTVGGQGGDGVLYLEWDLQ